MPWFGWLILIGMVMLFLLGMFYISVMSAAFKEISGEDEEKPRNQFHDRTH